MRARLILFVLLLTAAVPAVAWADAPWSPQAQLSGGFGYDAPLIYTPHGNGVVAAAKVGASSSTATVVATLHANGTPGTSRTANIVAAHLAAYASDHFVAAGSKPGTSSSQAPVQYITASPGAQLPAPRTLSGTDGQALFDVAGGAGGTVAFVTGTTSGTLRRYVWIRNGSSVKQALTIKVGSQAGGASVAVGKDGNVLVAWEDAGKIYSRHIGATGNVASQHTLGAGVQSKIETRFDDSGRQEVAWESQVVGEGDAESPASVYYTSAAKGSGFGAAKLVGTSSLTGTGRYVAAPGVRLVTSGTDSGVIAFTIYDGAHFRVQVANVAGGTVQPAATVSPDGEDAVMGDLAYARAGGTLVLWRSGTRGNDADGPQQVFANWRPAGQPGFGAPEVVSATQVPESPFAAVNPSNGLAVAAWGYAGGPVALSARPASSG